MFTNSVVQKFQLKKKKKGHLASVKCFLGPQLGRLEGLESHDGQGIESFVGLSFCIWSGMAWQLAGYPEHHCMVSQSGLGFLIVWWLWSHWTSYLSAQVSNPESFSDHGKKRQIAFYNLLQKSQNIIYAIVLWMR